MRQPLVLAFATFLTLVGTFSMGDAGADEVKEVRISFSGTRSDNLLFSSPPNSAIEASGAIVVLPPCSKAIQRDCIVTFQYALGNSKWKSATFLEPFPLDYKNVNISDGVQWTPFKSTALISSLANTKRNLPAMSRTGIWTLKDARHKGGTSYALSLQIAGTMLDSEGNRSQRATWNQNFTASISPISYGELTAVDKKNLITQEGTKCRMVESNPNGSIRAFCDTHYPYPSSIRFKVVMRLNSTLEIFSSGKWFVGRVAGALITERRNKDSVEITLEGSPISIGSAYVDLSKDPASYRLASTAYQKYLSVFQPGSTWTPVDEARFLEPTFGGWGYGIDDVGAIEAWSEFEKSVPFVFEREIGEWQIKSTELTEADKKTFAICGDFGSIAGIVSTNALIADPRPPLWNEEEEALSYKFASPHLRTDGSVNKGFYGLAISERLAACLWNKKALTPRAVVTIESLDGTSKVATIATSKAGGYFNFNAAGFTYSTNVAKVSFKK